MARAVKASEPTEVRDPNAGSRRERAQRTKARMIDAAHQTFVEHGYVGARMTDVATRAGVAVQTLYFTFHTKPELLRACYDAAVMGPEKLPPPLQPWFREALAATSARQALERFIAGNTQIVARVGLLDDVMRAAGHEPEAAEVLAATEAFRREGYRTIVDHLAGLATIADPDEATDVLLMLGESGTYRSLVIDAGWTLERFTAWLTSTAAKLLLPR